jgi:hypothetical protein
MKTFVTDWISAQRQSLATSLLSDSPDARALTRLLDQLEHDFDAHQNEELSTTQAAEESGYTPQAIRMLRRDRRISTRRADLPRKPGHGVVRGPQSAVPSSTPSIADRVLNRQHRRHA